MPKYFDYVQYIDIYGQFLSQLASEVLFEDNIHPDLKGTIIIAACIQKTILENSNLSKMTLRRQIHLYEAKRYLKIKQQIQYNYIQDRKKAIKKICPGYKKIQMVNISLHFHQDQYKITLPGKL